jgi:hypothetical protein
MGLGITNQTSKFMCQPEGEFLMYKSHSGFALCLLSLGWIATVEAAPKAPPTPTTLDSDKLAPGTFTGTITSAPNAERMFTINVSYQKIQLKPGQNLGRTNANLQREYNRILQLQNQLMNPGRRHNPLGTMQQLERAILQFQVQAARAEANLFQVIPATQKVEFQAEENVKVRKKHLPEEFDEKGNIKHYTAAELVKLKGKDSELPGYESSAEDLKVGQVVQVTLRVHRKSAETHPASSSASSSSSAADKEKAEGATGQHRMQVRMIMILKDDDSTLSTQPPPSKSKNK